MQTITMKLILKNKEGDWGGVPQGHRGRYGPANPNRLFCVLRGVL